jgi:hypothetical protein
MMDSEFRTDYEVEFDDLSRRRVNWWVVMLVILGAVVWVGMQLARPVLWVWDVVTGYSGGKR